MVKLQKPFRFYVISKKDSNKSIHFTFFLNFDIIISQMNKREINISGWGWLLILGLMIITAMLSNYTRDGFRTEIIGGDGRGYYAYLPVVFMHQSLDFSEIARIEQSGGNKLTNKHYYLKQGEKLINKYTAGTALLILPFFLFSWLLSLICGLDVNGYSIIFQYGVLLASVFYAWLGLVFTSKILLRIGFRKMRALLSCILILLGSNLFFYTFLHPSTSHVYSFSMMAVFLYYLLQFFQRNRLSDLLFTSMALGLSVLIRPFNFLGIFLVFFLADNLSGILRKVRESLMCSKKLTIALIPFLSVISIQLCINLIQSGQLFQWSYKNEGFYFDNPQILNVWFSFRKGLFIYTPLILISLLGLIPLYRQSRFRALSALFFFLLISYFISSWWNWYYGDSFGMRPYIDYYPFFAILLAYLISSLKGWFLRGIGIVLFSLIIFLNLFQTWQYQNSILHHADMDKEKYCYVFLKTGEEYRNILGDGPESIYREKDLKKLATYTNAFSQQKQHWRVKETALDITEKQISDTICLFNNKIEFGCTLSLIASDLPEILDSYFVECSFELMEIDTNASSGAFLVASVTSSSGEKRFYKSFRIKQVPDRQTRQLEQKLFKFKLEEILHADDVIKIYIWNPDKNKFYIDDMQLNFYCTSVN